MISRVLGRMRTGKVDEALFDKTIVPLSMVGHGLAGA